MEIFEEIEGAMLESVSVSEATYVDAGSSGSKPLKVEGCSLVFDLGWFVIENRFSVISPENLDVGLNELVGLKVGSAYSTEEEIRINFELGSYISVSMKDEDFVGPEAASYTPKRGDIVVFN